MMMINFGLQMMPADGCKNCMHCHSILKRWFIFWCNVLVHLLTWVGCLIDFVLSTQNFYPVFKKYIKKTNLFQSAWALFVIFCKASIKNHDALLISAKMIDVLPLRLGLF